MTTHERKVDVIAKQLRERKSNKPISLKEKGFLNKFFIAYNFNKFHSTLAIF